MEPTNSSSLPRPIFGYRPIQNDMDSDCHRSGLGFENGMTSVFNEGQLDLMDGCQRKYPNNIFFRASMETLAEHPSMYDYFHENESLSRPSSSWKHIESFNLWNNNNENRQLGTLENMNIYNKPGDPSEKNKEYFDNHLLDAKQNLSYSANDTIGLDVKPNPSTLVVGQVDSSNHMHTLGKAKELKIFSRMVNSVDNKSLQPISKPFKPVFKKFKMPTLNQPTLQSMNLPANIDSKVPNKSCTDKQNTYMELKETSTDLEHVKAIGKLINNGKVISRMQGFKAKSFVSKEVPVKRNTLSPIISSQFELNARPMSTVNKIELDKDVKTFGKENKMRSNKKKVKQDNMSPDNKTFENHESTHNKNCTKQNQPLELDESSFDLKDIKANENSFNNEIVGAISRVQGIKAKPFPKKKAEAAESPNFNLEISKPWNNTQKLEVRKTPKRLEKKFKESNMKTIKQESNSTDNKRPENTKCKLGEYKKYFKSLHPYLYKKESCYHEKEKGKKPNNKQNSWKCMNKEDQSFKQISEPSKKGDKKISCSMNGNCFNSERDCGSVESKASTTQIAPHEVLAGSHIDPEELCLEKNLEHVASKKMGNQKLLKSRDSTSREAGSKHESSSMTMTVKNVASIKDHLYKLQTETDFPVWVQCDSCRKWRCLHDVFDPSVLPKKWTCSLNSDENMNNCSISEEEYDEDEHDRTFVFTKFTLGSVVWARLSSQWWPAMIDDDPDTDTYFWLPTYLNEPNTKSVALQSAIEEARMAFALPIKERRRQFCFATRYKGRWFVSSS